MGYHDANPGDLDVLFWLFILFIVVIVVASELTR